MIRKGEPGQFSGAELRRWGFVKRLASSRLEVIRALGLPAGAVAEDPSQGGKWQAVRVDLKGAINAEKVDQAERLIQDEIRLHNVNFVCLWIDSAGGPPDECLRLAEFLADLDPAAVRTVAYIPSEARAQAALVAMACDQIVMHPEAVLGGPGSPQMSRRRDRAGRADDPQQLAPRKMRSWSLWAAMIDPQIEVFRCTRLGDEEFFSAEELAAAQPKADAGGNGPPLARRPLRDHARDGLPRRRHAGGRFPPGQPHGRELCPVQATLRPGRRSDLGRAGLGRHCWSTPSAVRACRRCC